MPKTNRLSGPRVAHSVCIWSSVPPIAQFHPSGSVTRPLGHSAAITKPSTMTMAFTFIELLVVLAILAILAALLLPALTRAKTGANRAVCLNNLKQINAALRMYADDSSDKSPWVGTATNRILDFCYKELIQDYVAARGSDQSRQKLFACPSDTFCYHLQPQDSQYLPKPRHDLAAAYFSSYSFNGGNQFANTFTNTGFGP